MKIVKIILILLVVSAAINFVRGDHSFPLPQVLPFCGGHEASILYDLICGFGLIGLGLWGLNRLKRNTSNSQYTDANQPEIYEAEFREPSAEQDDSEEPS